MTRCVGIDLAWAPHNPSGGFALQVEAGVAHAAGWREGLGGDEEILAFIAAFAGDGPALVAIDAPILVPNEQGSRGCDREVSRAFRSFEAGAHPANLEVLGRYGGLRAETLARRVERELGFIQDPQIPRQGMVRQLVEVYPHPGMVALFGLKKTLKYKRGDLARRRAELERLQRHLTALEEAEPALRPGRDWCQEIGALRGHRLKRYEDLLDSLFCAYVAAYCWHHGPAHYAVFGTREGGHILVPIPPEQRGRFAL